MVKKSWMMLMDGLGKIAAGIGIVTAGSILRPGRGVPSFWEFFQSPSTVRSRPKGTLLLLSSHLTTMLPYRKRHA